MAVPWSLICGANDGHGLGWRKPPTAGATKVEDCAGRQPWAWAFKMVEVAANLWGLQVCGQEQDKDRRRASQQTLACGQCCKFVGQGYEFNDGLGKAAV